MSNFDGDANLGGGSSLALKLGEAGERVGVVRLESAWKSEQLRRPNFVKIDVEGSEAKVLDGSRQWLSSTKPRLLIATHSQRCYRDCSQILHEIGYQIFESATLIKAEQNGWEGRGDPDLLAVSENETVTEETLKALAAL